MLLHSLFFVAPYTYKNKKLLQAETDHPPKHTQLFFLREFFGKLLYK